MLPNVRVCYLNMLYVIKSSWIGLKIKSMILKNGHEHIFCLVIYLIVGAFAC